MIEKESVLHAGIIEITTNEDGIFIIGFSEDDSYERVLIIQYVEELSEDDIEMGWSRYYLEYGGDNAGAYSCIKEIIMGETAIEVYLNDQGQSIFKLANIKVEFSQNHFTELTDAFKKVFENEDVVLRVLA